MLHSDREPNRKSSLRTSTRRPKGNIKRDLKLIDFGSLKRPEVTNCEVKSTPTMKYTVAHKFAYQR
jgi:hypothetical protein